MFRTSNPSAYATDMTDFLNKADLGETYLWLIDRHPEPSVRMAKEAMLPRPAEGRDAYSHGDLTPAELVTEEINGEKVESLRAVAKNGTHRGEARIAGEFQLIEEDGRRVVEVNYFSRYLDMRQDKLDFSSVRTLRLAIWYLKTFADDKLVFRVMENNAVKLYVKGIRVNGLNN